MIVTLIILLSSQATAAIMPEKVNIELERPNTVGKKVVITLTREQSGTLECETPVVPVHGVTIKTFKNLKAPFTARIIQPNCERIIRWGKTERCYLQHENEIVDKLIRVCTEI